jgi:F-type H+-transporting ATPase subunit epsilon
MAGELLPFKLVTPVGILIDEQVREVTAVNPLGEFGVLPEHVDYITSLEPGILTLRMGDGRERFYLLYGGLAEVKDGQLTVLAQGAEAIEELAAQPEAATAIEAAAERLRHLSFYEPEYENALRALKLAQARQRAAEIAHQARSR